MSRIGGANALKMNDGIIFAILRYYDITSVPMRFGWSFHDFLK